MLDIIVNPFITILLFLYQLLGGNVVLAIVVFTILIRLATYPLTIKQQRSTKAMQELQPELKKLQEKYKNDRERLAQEQWELYRKHGVNPLAGCLPLLIQLPIMLALYRAIVATLAATPTQLLDLANRLWIANLSAQVPLSNKFLWLNLAVPDPLYVLPVLVVVTTWLQQKLLMPATPSGGTGDRQADQTAQISRQMMLIMPLMFGFFSLSFASGLSIYFIASNLIGIGQYALMGRLDLKQLAGLKLKPVQPATDPATDSAAAPAAAASTTRPRREATPVAAPAEPSPEPKSGRKRGGSGSKKRSGIYDSRASRARAKGKAKG
ncbi:MAG: YidC/Oxa1 family membrane protein insertase [Aggregatilineaceae bacterium]